MLWVQDVFYYKYDPYINLNYAHSKNIILGVTCIDPDVFGVRLQSTIWRIRIDVTTQI